MVGGVKPACHTLPPMLSLSTPRITFAEFLIFYALGF